MRGAAWRSVIGAALLAAGALPSCTAPVFIVSAGLSVAEVSTGAYVRGALESGMAVPFDDIIAAADGAVAALELKPLTRRIEGRRCVIATEELGGRNITIIMVKKTPAMTKITIRIGVFGDQAISRLVLAEMQKELDKKNAGPRGQGDGPPADGRLIYVPQDDEP